MQCVYQGAVLTLVAMVAICPLTTQAKATGQLRSDIKAGDYSCGADLPYGEMFDCQGNIVMSHYDTIKKYFATCEDTKKYCKKFGTEGYCNYADFHKVCLATCEHCEKGSVDGVVPASVIESYMVEEMMGSAQSYNGTGSK